MRREILFNAEAVERRAAAVIAEEARAAFAARGRFLVALSRATPVMLRALALEDVPWFATHVFQVDERVAPAGDPARNLTSISETLLELTALPPGQLHAMPVEWTDLSAAADDYAATLRHAAGSPAVLDLVHLGLGTNGHTASLLPDDAVTGMMDRDVGITGPFMGWRRMTFTYPVLDRARKIVWVVTGNDKSEMVERLVAADPTIPAGRVRGDGALLLADDAAGARLA